MNLKGNVDLSHAIIGVFILGIIIGFGAGVASPMNLNQGQENGDTDRTFTTEGEPVLGDEDAPVTMVVFEDYECPFCKRFEEGAFPQIKEEYVDSGQVKVIWKDYPLRIHPWAGPSAMAMECVYREDNAAFWEIKKDIFDQQSELSVENAESKIIGWAEREGVSNESIQTCMDQDSVVSEIEGDMTEGGRLGTPTAFINGQKISGAQPFSQYQKVIESELSNQ